MKIVFFIQNFSRSGGSERVTSIIANYLCVHNCDISVVSICGNNTCFFELNPLIKLNTLINEEVVDNRRKFFSVLHRFHKFIKENNPDIIIDVFASLSIYTNLIKNMENFKNITWEHYNFLNNMGLNKIGRQVAIKFSDKIVTLTETDMNLYIKNSPQVKEKINYIFNPTPYPNASLGNEKKKIVIAVGRLEKLKGFSNLLAAWKRVSNEFPDWYLYIIGEGEERINLEKQIEKDNILNVKLPGQKKNLEEYYLCSNILISVSEREGLPMTMIEAQSFGLPIISFDYMTGPRDIIHDGYDGIIVEHGSQDKMNQILSESIIKLISDSELRGKMSENAKKSSERFSIKRIGNEWLKTINGLIED